MAGLYPLSRMQQFDGNGRPLSGARLFLFDGGTSTPRIGYRDSSLTSPHPNPIVADSAGRLPLIYLDDGFYRHRLTTRVGTLIFDDDGLPVLSSTAGGSGTSVDPDSVFKTRDVKIRFDDQPLAGYVRLNGRTIGSASSGATERANADTQSLYEELWPFANISVTGGKGGSAAADFAANKPLVLPDMAGRLLAGMDTMGNGPAGRITSALLGSDPAAPGAAGGAQTATITASNLPVSSPWLATATATLTGTTITNGVHAHAGVADAAGTPAHNHNYDGPATRNQGVQVGTDTPVWAGVATGTTTTENQNMGHTHTVTIGISGDHGHNVQVSGTPVVTMQSNAGGAQAFNKLNPLMTFMIFIRL
jgi:hypothetical protein